MARKKLERFKENTERDNIIEPGKPFYQTCKGNWNSQFFKNNNPIVLELGCGRGEYSTGLAMQIPSRNFIGIDVKGERLWKGSVIAETQALKNVAFLRTQIQHLEEFFVPGEICDIWLPFPDPRPKDRDDKRRLTHPRFLEMYQHLTSPNSLIHLKTDNFALFEYTLEVLKDFSVKELNSTTDLFHSDLITYHYGIKTRYEQKYVAEGLKINYLNFKFS